MKSLFLLAFLVQTCAAFAFAFAPIVIAARSLHKSMTTTTITTTLSMGLFDEPLPPRPPPRNSTIPPSLSKNDDDDNDDDVFNEEIARIFQMLPDGKEARGLLPALPRRLDTGIGCYLEHTDRKVQILVDKTQCHPDDAAWALEACQGDITEAWVCISTARRSLLNQRVSIWNNDNSLVTPPETEIDWDADLIQWQTLQQQNNGETFQPVDRESYEQRKQDNADQERKQGMKDLFGGGEPDQQWLPSKNPNPVDDEPWFTG